MSRAYVINRQRLRRAEFIQKKKATIMKCLEATRQYITSPQFGGGIPLIDLDVPLVSAMDNLHCGSMLPDYPAVWADNKDKVQGALVPLTAAKAMNSIAVENNSCREEQANSEETLEELLDFLKETGQHVSEVKALPSGAVRITVDELLSGMKTREREYAYAGGRQ